MTNDEDNLIARLRLGEHTTEPGELLRRIRSIQNELKRMEQAAVVSRLSLRGDHRGGDVLRT